MKIINFYILLIILILIFILIENLEFTKIYLNDILYQSNLFFIKNIESESIDLSQKIYSLDTPLTENIKVLIISYDNRKELEYLSIHNNNISEYCKKWKNIEYKFFDSCDKNMYWCKLYLIYNELITNKYDYIMWMDSDTIIINQYINLKQILNIYNYDIFISYDISLIKNDTLNAGCFIIKNSKIGHEFLSDCIGYFENSKCLDNNNNLKGIYSARCYEQGTMNYYINNKYNKYTKILSKEIIHNSNLCTLNTFILHYFGGSTYDNSRVKCFNECINININ